MWLDSGSQRVPGASGRWGLVSPTSTGRWQCQLEKAIGGVSLARRAPHAPKCLGTRPQPHFSFPERGRWGSEAEAEAGAVMLRVPVLQHTDSEQLVDAREVGGCAHACVAAGMKRRRVPPEGADAPEK